jgi:hypothetical protein
MAALAIVTFALLAWVISASVTSPIAGGSPGSGLPEQSELGTVTALHPSARAGSMMVWDPAFDSLLLFGGHSASSSYLSDTWIYSDASMNWTELSLTVHPTARSDGVIVWDPGIDAALLFGGHNASGSLSDTWIFESSTMKWTRLSTPVHPVARSGEMMVWDPTFDSVVLFGGYDASRGYLSDTWIYSDATLNWSELSLSIHPAARSNGDMVWDPGLGDALIFGGQNNLQGYLSSTWVFGPVSKVWTQLSLKVTPTGRSEAMMVWDADLGNAVLFGGHNGAQGYLNSTWVFDTNSKSWVKLSLSTKPTGRDEAAMAWDPGLQEIFLFGGYNSNQGYLSSTWVFSDSTSMWAKL